jgi:hypothetical protein
MGIDGLASNCATHASGAVVAHGGWQHAYDSLLRELARNLRRRGRGVEFLLCGDLPIGSAEAADRILLVDEAARMDRALLARLADRPPCPLVLAGLPELDSAVEAQPARIQLQTLSQDEARQFVIEWLMQADKSPRLTIPAIERLLLHAAGVPRVLVQLLKAALFMATDDASLITPRDIDEVAAFRGA